MYCNLREYVKQGLSKGFPDKAQFESSETDIVLSNLVTDLDKQFCNDRKANKQFIKSEIDGIIFYTFYDEYNKREYCIIQ